MRVEQVQWHLNGVEFETLLVCHFKHVQVNTRILVAGKSDVPNFACSARFNQCRMGAVLMEDPVRVFVPENLMMLDEIDMIDGEAL